jgi:putative effector of murein hydrolase
MQEIFTNHLCIEYGFVVLLLSISTICLSIKIYNKEMILKGVFLTILSISFFAIIINIEQKENLDNFTTYLSSMGFGVLFLIILALFTSWDEDESKI